MWRIMMLLMACHTDPGVAVPLPGEGPRERAATIRVELLAAQNAWSAGNRDDASERVLAAYAQQFEPLEPALREIDAEAVLALEYDFGRLSRMLSRKGQPVRINGAVQDVLVRMDALVGELPVTVGEPEVVPVAEPAPTAVEVQAPKREFTTYGAADE